MLCISIMQGRLTRDPELRRTSSGVAVASFSIAVDRDYSGKGEERKTDFFDCVAWRATGEFITKYFRKGNMVVLHARPQQRSYTDKDGNQRYAVEFNVESAYFGESKKQENDNNAGGNGGYAAPAGGGYAAPANGYGYAAPPAPQQPAYQQPAPQQNQYQQPSYQQPMPQQGQYQQPAPQQGQYQQPAPQQSMAPQAGNYALLEEDDAQLPF